MSLPEPEIRQYFSGDVCQEADKNRLAPIQDGLVGINGNIIELGYILGDRLYHAILEGGIERAEVRRLLRLPLTGVGEAEDLYFRLVRELK